MKTRDLVDFPRSPALPPFRHGIALLTAEDGRIGAMMGDQQFGSVLGETTNVHM
jgi:hypothetical protein